MNRTAEITRNTSETQVRVVAGDASRLRAATGWEPAIPLEQTVADVLEAVQQSPQPARMRGS